MALQKALVSSKSNDWETPQEFFDELNKEFKFTLDPCCQIETAKCSKYFTEEEDGLRQDWSKDVVFMNPPHGRNTETWTKKAYEEYKKGATVVCLIVSTTDKSFWHNYILPYASQIRFIRGRLSLKKANNKTTSAPFSSALVIFDNKKYTPRILGYAESLKHSLKIINKNQMRFHQLKETLEKENIVLGDEYVGISTDFIKSHQFG